MPLHEPSSHTFLIRIWVEETVDEAGHLAWRGHITHLPDEERRYLETFDEIARVIREQVGERGGDAGAGQRGDEGTQPTERGR